jgi:hypothetical protein
VINLSGLLPYPPSSQLQVSQFDQLIPKIGIAIGNSAAHELGHQFALENMDCPTQHPCPAGNFYEESLNNGDFQYIGFPMQWTSTDSIFLMQELLGNQ